MGRELKLVTVAPGVGEREEMMSGAEIAMLEDVRVSVGGPEIGLGRARPWSELTERERVSGRGPPCPAERSG